MLPGSLDGDRLRRYMDAIEYIDFDAYSGQARLEIVASSHRHSQGPHSADTSDEWSDEHLLAVTSELRKHATTLLACLSGWVVESLMPARPRVRSVSVSGQKVVIRQFDSAKDVARDGWKSVSALLHLRRWDMFRDVDDGFVDLYVSRSRLTLGRLLTGGA